MVGIVTALIVEDCELMRPLIDGVADAIVECESGDAAYAAHQIRATFHDARILIVSMTTEARTARAAAHEKRARECCVLKENLQNSRSTGRNPVEVWIAPTAANPHNPSRYRTLNG